MQSDGTIRAEDVPPGTYTLDVRLAAQTADPLSEQKIIGSIKKTVMVPETSEGVTQAFDPGH